MSREGRQEKGAAAVLNRTPEMKKAISSSTRAAGIQAASRRKSRSQHISEPLAGGLREQSKITRQSASKVSTNQNVIGRCVSKIATEPKIGSRIAPAP
jgi:hypothetical protein